MTQREDNSSPSLDTGELQAKAVEGVRQKSTLFWATLALAISLGFWSIVQVFYEAWLLAEVQFGFAIAAAALVYVVYRVGYRIYLAHLVCMLLLAVLIMSSYYSGGFNGGNLSLFLVVPVGAVTVAGRSGLLWLIPTGAWVLFLALAEGNDFDFPYLTPTEGQQLDQMLCWLTSVVVISLLINRYEAGRRNAEASTARLLQSTKDLSAERSELLAEVGQELRDPVHILLANLDLLREGDGSEKEIGKWIDQARSAGLVAAAIVENILSTWTPSLRELNQVSLRELARRLADSASMILVGSVEKRRLHIEPGLPEKILADGSGLMRLVAMLAGRLGARGIRASDLTVSLGTMEKSDEEPGLRIEFRITVDNAAESTVLAEKVIADLRRAKIFSYLKGLMDIDFGEIGANDGELVVAVELGQIHKIEEPAVVRQESEDGEEKLPLRVLVVDDGKLNRKIAVHLCTRMGCEVDEAVDGRQALDMTERNQYDLVLVDFELPDLRGDEVASAIRKKAAESGKEVPDIVALSAHTERHMKSMKETGLFDAIVQKPFSQDRLGNILVNLKGRKRRIKGG